MLSLFTRPPLDCPRCGCHLSKSSSAASATDHQHRTTEERYCTECGLDLDTEQDALLPGKLLALGFHVSKLANFLRLHGQDAAAYRIQIFQYGQVFKLGLGHDDPSREAQPLGFDSTAPAGVLISRSKPFTCPLHFGELHTAEFLALEVKLDLQLSIAKGNQFARRFMTGQCRLTESDLQSLLTGSARQACLELISAHSLRELQDHSALQIHLQDEISKALNSQLEQLGLQLHQVTVTELSHHKLSQAREDLGEKLASLYLIIDEKRAQVEHRKTLDALYSESEWQQIKRDEERVRLRYRHEEMRQQLGQDLSWLYLRGEHENAKKRLSRAKLRQDEAERLHAIQLRELELYARIAEASTRKQAIERGAAETVANLEHQLRAKKEQQQNENDEWLHIRTLARIKMRSESELAQMHSKEAAQLLQQKIEHQLQQQRLTQEIELNQRKAQGLQQEEQAAWLHDQQRKQQLREQALEEEAHQTRLLSLSLETEVRAREFKRLQEWEEQIAQQRQQKLARENALAAQEHALKVAQLQQEIDRLEQHKMQMHNQIQHDKLQRTLALEAEFALQTQQRDLERIAHIAKLDDTSKIAVSEVGNASLLSELNKLQTLASMSPEQILAMHAAHSEPAARAAAEIKRQTHGLSWEDTVRMLHERVQEEKAQREAEQLRRHEIDLQAAQNAAFHHANKPQRK